MRRLALCFDGTWNDLDDATNVSRIHAAIRAGAGARPDDAAQLKYYDAGVGTESGVKVRGGALGVGLGKNVAQGYAWLVRHWQQGDQIYLFGFSRGAYTARSLAGLIGRRRLPTAGTDVHAQAAAEMAAQRAQIKGSTASDVSARPPVPIHFIGVWDTVGALGIPSLNIYRGERFHETDLGAHVDHAYHALAIDEHRTDYEAALWKHVPDPSRQVVEQRWFPGAHANVGGGYPDDLLPDGPLAWIAEHARKCGLDLADEVLRLGGTEHRSPVVDSYGKFAFGLYRVAKGFKRFFRPIGTYDTETIDPSAFRKWAADPGYRPRNLAHARRDA